MRLASKWTVWVRACGWHISRLKPASLHAHQHDHLTGHANFVFKGTVKLAGSFFLLCACAYMSLFPANYVVAGEVAAGNIY